ncbi:MAG: YceI family protein [Halioglobus sp.]
MKYLSIVSNFIAVMVLAGLANSAFAQWALNAESSAVRFITTKNNAIAESHEFGSLSGSISAEGDVQVAIALDSVETLVPIRNQRMRELLFETANFPQAKIVASVDRNVIDVAAKGGVLLTEIPITLSLHGYDKALTVPVLLVGTSGGNLLVQTSRPILVKAADFGLEKGVSLLREAAGLSSISTAVPVSFQLLFVPSV